jgi:hypothetical protein
MNEDIAPAGRDTILVGTDNRPRGLHLQLNRSPLFENCFWRLSEPTHAHNWFSNSQLQRHAHREARAFSCTVSPASPDRFPQSSRSLLPTRCLRNRPHPFALLFIQHVRETLSDPRQPLNARPGNGDLTRLSSLVELDSTFNARYSFKLLPSKVDPCDLTALVFTMCAKAVKIQGRG